ncbi:hypothetical protein BLOT_013309 [Blomia tropicalis]|nr:hypothetical protein BLOT_013309 [Blomia tropicalis]
MGNIFSEESKNQFVTHSTNINDAISIISFHQPKSLLNISNIKRLFNEILDTSINSVEANKQTRERIIAS